MSPELRRGPLHDMHLGLGATMAEFGGWLMPIQYPGGGVIAEHTAVRENVGVFDVSHLGKVSINGAGAARFVNECFTNDLGKIGPGQAQYTMCCTDSGGVVDDLIVYLVSPEEIFCVPNAANTTQVCRTGYTGEHGYELLPRWDDAAPLWSALVDAAAVLHGRPCGLGARDTLRTEMGYPLHGQDLSLDISPVQAGASWAVGWRKPAFWGREALLAERAAGPKRRLWGLRASGRGVPRPQMPVMAGGRQVGHTTSGTFSPTLRTGIALALLDTAAGLDAGAEVSVDVRGRPLPCTVVKPPFVVPHVR